MPVTGLFVQDYPWLLASLLARGGAFMLLLVAAGLLLRDYHPRNHGRLGALFSLGAAAFILISTPGVAHYWSAWHLPVMVLSAPAPFVFWLFSRALLDDGFALRRWHALPWLVMASVGAVPCFIARPAPLEVQQAIRLALALPAVAFSVLTAFHVAMQWRGDLVEARRRVRLHIVVGIAGYILLIHLILLSVDGDARYPANIVSGLIMGILGGYLGWRIFGLRLSTPVPSDVVLRITTGSDTATEASAQPSSRAASAPAGLQDQDQDKLDRLLAWMTVEQVYREADLTIGSLAQRMKLPEHRLRRLINEALGHRNFNAFLNTYRVEDAKRALGDRRYDAVAILTISTEAGFQSLGPFNRAFKAATGQTPSEFRRAAQSVGGPAAAAAQPLADSCIGQPIPEFGEH